MSDELKNTNSIKFHLAKRFAGQLGGHPNHIGKSAISDGKKFSINLKDSNEDSFSASAWSSTIVTDEMSYKVLLSLLDPDSHHVTAIVIGYDNSVIYVPQAVYGFSFIWDDPISAQWISNSIKIESETSWSLGEWIPLSLSDTLMISAWLEMATQDGLEWKPNSDHAELLQVFRSFLGMI